MEPTIAQAVISGILVAIILCGIIVATVYGIAEAWRTKRGTIKNAYAYGKDDACELKFITEGKLK